MKTVTKISLPSTLKKIGKDAFRDYTALSGISPLKNLESIGARAFSGCTGLKKIVFPKTLEELPEEMV